jgi:hypothetical protein
MARIKARIEVSNRFDLLASLCVDEETTESSISDVTSSKQIQEINDDYSTKDFWEIPKYVEKSIPCAPVITTQVTPFKSIAKVKKSRSIKIVKPSECEEQQDEIEVETRPSTNSYYPPQPYKFKQTPSSKYNSIST